METAKDAPLLMSELRKRGIYNTMEFYSALKRMKFCQFQVNG
jgi:hypothetical protein